MKRIFLIIGIVMFNIHSIQSQSIKSKLNEIRKDLKKIDYIKDIREFEKEYPEFIFQNMKLPLNNLETKLEKRAAKLEINKVTKVVKNKDGSCGIIKVFDIGEANIMRVKYIYLQDKTNQGKEVANEILIKFKNGIPFSELAKLYGKDGNAKKRWRFRLV